ncbi:hypothetical protein AA14337_0930 [Acetobacter malorum DSM 14337]|uniref:Glycosyltransferase n=1 Tax=Acetobacter malorum DSM 14337 TaxID=1307910 RepID=A0ABQ0PQK1_9PROT|nr:hypothetical protein [Acetobacter malorum]GBQ77816.1 hypothetical protein AA14337_0930 [Acetobacter malorum DSM 14337]
MNAQHKNTFILVSWHGHVLYASNEAYKWLYWLQNDNDPVVLREGDEFSIEVDGVSFFLTSSGGEWVFYDGTKYLCLNEKEEIIKKTNDVNLSEKFFLVDLNFYKLFSDNFRGIWVSNAQECIGPEGIRFGHGNRIKFGKYNISHDDVIRSRSQEIAFDNGQTVFKKVKNFPVSKIHIHPMGNIANRALQYLVAKNIQLLCSGLEIENIFLPEWGIDTRVERLPSSRSCTLSWNRYWIDVPGLADCLKRHVIDTLFLDAFCFNIEHFPSRDVSRELLRDLQIDQSIQGFGMDEIVFNIRGGEVLENVQKDYIVLPKEYYQMIIQESGLKPVFFGQIGNNEYSRYLREAFPDARFIEGKGAIHDFEVLRQSFNIAIAVSTFSWLAAWLSHARNIYMPIGGIFNPNQMKLQNFLPIGETSYKFIALPYMEAENLYTNQKVFFEKLDNCARYMRFVDHDTAQKILSDSRSSWAPQPIVNGFEEDFYIQSNKDVDSKLYITELSALQHYIHIGYQAKVTSKAFDEQFYLRRYPDAAYEVGVGKFATLFDHYIKKGQHLGYVGKGKL